MSSETAGADRRGRRPARRSGNRPRSVRAEAGLGADTTVTMDAPSVAIAGGGPAAARVNDPVSVSPALAAWIAAVTAVCNGIAPGSVTPPTGPIGQVAAGSAKVTIG
ncbi:MAG: hypothetical protein QME96_14560 [Myxococcota bacterium]|nr:hypothetical protein [Myxococcota bacterium]